MIRSIKKNVLMKSRERKRVEKSMRRGSVSSSNCLIDCMGIG
jgi:hypothetical protein